MPNTLGMRSTTHPSVYALLDLPFGAVNGYLSVAIAYRLAQTGVSAEAIGALVALYFMPQIWKPFWAPMVDMTFSAKGWYVIGVVLSAVGVLVMAMCSTPPVTLKTLTVAAVLASLATTFLGMGVEKLIAHSTAPEQQGRAGGWLQGGNFAGSGLGGGAALWLSTHVSHPWITGALLGASFLLCCLALPLVRPSDQSTTASHPGIGRVLRDLWDVARSPRGYLALLVLFVPIGSGGAAALFAVVTDDWHTSAAAVALANGTLSGLVSLLGCLTGGYLSDLFNRKLAYVGYGLVMGLCSLAMALSPHTQTNYVLFVLLYSFISGVSFAGFTAVTLEAIGGGAAATKYNVFASLANIPTAYLAAVEGWARTRHGVNAFLYVDFAAPIVGALIFGAGVLLATRRSPRAVSVGVA